MSDDPAPSSPPPRTRAASPIVVSLERQNNQVNSDNLTKCYSFPGQINVPTSDLSNLNCIRVLLTNNPDLRAPPDRGSLCNCFIFHFMPREQLAPRSLDPCDYFNYLKGNSPSTTPVRQFKSRPGPLSYDIQLNYTPRLQLYDVPMIFISTRSASLTRGTRGPLPVPNFNPRVYSINEIPFQLFRVSSLYQLTYVSRLRSGLLLHRSLARHATARARLPAVTAVTFPVYSPTLAPLTPVNPGQAGRAAGEPASKHYEYIRNFNCIYDTFPTRETTRPIHDSLTLLTTASASPRRMAPRPTGPPGPPGFGTLAGPKPGLSLSRHPRGSGMTTRTGTSASYAEVHPNQPP